MKISDATSEYLNGIIDIRLYDGEKNIDFSIFVGEENKLKLMDIRSKIEQKETKEGIYELRDVMKSILKESYPDKDDKWLSMVYTKFGDELLLEIHFSFKWQDREAYEALIEAKKKELLKLRNGETNIFQTKTEKKSD